MTRALSLLFVCVPVIALAQAPADGGGAPVAVTTGRGVVHAVPDRAWITVGAESRAASAREAQRRNTEAMRPLLDKLRAAGVPADAVRTIGYDVQYEWDFVDNKRVGRGYVARNTVEIRVDAVERVGELLEVAGTGGATNLGGVRFDFKDRAAHEREALKLAVVEARAKADALAAAAGRTVDRVLRIDEDGASRPGPMPVLAMMRQADAGGAAPPIAAGEAEVAASVSLTVTLR